MDHDIFLSYDNKDSYACRVICEAFMDNGIKSWVYGRDYSPKDSVNTVKKAVTDSRAMVVVYSKDSKTSNHVATEVDIAFKNNLPIIIFNIDDSSNHGYLEFFKKGVCRMSAGPDNSVQLKALIAKTSDSISEGIVNIKVDNNVSFNPPSGISRLMGKFRS